MKVVYGVPTAAERCATQAGTGQQTQATQLEPDTALHVHPTTSQCGGQDGLGTPAGAIAHPQ